MSNPGVPSSSQVPSPTSAPGAGTALGRVGFLQHRTGDRIKDRYEVLQHLGGGNFGSVYRVRDTAVGNILACKEMHVLDDPNTSIDERGQALDLFKREALNLATLRHPNIPSAYFEQEDGHWRICPRCGFDFPAAPVCPDHGATLMTVNQRYYLMMDFVDGPTLEELAVRVGKPLEEKQSLAWMEQIGSALKSLHRVGIVHRDIKPDNIKIRSDNKTAMLLDFGLTKKVEEAGGYGTVSISGTTRFGTLGYAPENPRERENPERRSDIYALGMTLYRLLSCRDPQDPIQLKEMRDYSPRHFNSKISPATERLIAVAAAPEVSWRYQTIEDFLDDLKAIHTPNDSQLATPAITYADGSRARNANELAQLVERRPDESLQYLFDGTLTTWLQQNGFAAAARAALRVVDEHKEQPHRALELFRRSLYPSTATGILPQLAVAPNALDFGEVESGSVLTGQLRIRNTGPGLLWGEIEIEDAADNKTPLPGLQVQPAFEGNDSILDVQLDTRKVSSGNYSGTLKISTETECRRIAVSYVVEALQLFVEPDTLNFGTIEVGRRETRKLRVRRQKLTANGGSPRGTLYAGDSLKGLQVPERFEGTEPFEVTVDATTSDIVAQLYQGTLQLDTNGGRFRVPVSYQISLSPARLLNLIVGTAFIAALCGGALRLGYALMNPAYALAWLVQTQPSGSHTIPAPDTFGWGAIAAGAMVGWFFSKQIALRLVSDKRHRRDPALRSIIATFIVLCGMPFGWLAAFLLHFAFWGLGDWLLYPPAQLQTLVQPIMAPIAWAGAGGIGGLLWGIARAGAAIGYAWARYVVMVLLGVIFLMLLLMAMLA